MTSLIMMVAVSMGVIEAIVFAFLGWFDVELDTMDEIVKISIVIYILFAIAIVISCVVEMPVIK